MKDLRAGTLIAGLALFIAIGGTATAASGLINGKQIKKGTVTAKQIKDKTITAAKLNPSALKSLKGQPGAPGVPGATGPAGATGSPGVVSPFYFESQFQQLDPASPLAVLELPAGEYMISAKANVTSSQVSPVDINCSVWADDVSSVDNASADAVVQNQSVPMSLMAVARVEDGIDLRCNAYEFTGNARDIKLIAVPVAG